CRDDLIWSYRVGEAPGEVEVGLAVLEQRRAGDDLSSSGGQDLRGALDGSNTAADAACQARRDAPHDGDVVAACHRRIEIDDLHLREALEPLHLLLYVRVANRELLALNQLDDGAALEVDCGDQHGRSNTKT